jgi:NAD/NADP transhydrogenase beta subunit
VENELFYNPKTEMLFGDAKKSIESRIASVKGL